MTDLRERLRGLDLLDPPDQWSAIESRRPTTPVRLQGGVGGRLTAAAVALAVAAAGTFFAVDRLSPERTPVASLDMSTWSRHEVPLLRLAFTSPMQWRLQPFDELVGHSGMAGALVSNTEHAFEHPDLGSNETTTIWSMRGVPEDAVVISIERIDAIGYPRLPTDTPLPLSLSRAKEQTSYRPTPTWTHLWLPFVLNGRGTSVRVWFGPDASDEDREIARRIVASIEPMGPDEPSFDGWRVDVDVVTAPSGPLEVVVGPIRAVPENEAHTWIKHDIVLRNTGDLPLNFDDTRTTALLGRPGPELYAADRGCGYGDPGRGQPLEWGACLGYLDAFMIRPHGSERRDVGLWKGLRGLAPLRAGTYVFEKVYRFRVGERGPQREVEVRLRYRITTA